MVEEVHLILIILLVIDVELIMLAEIILIPIQYELDLIIIITLSLIIIHVHRDQVLITQDPQTQEVMGDLRLIITITTTQDQCTHDLRHHLILIEEATIPHVPAVHRVQGVEILASNC